jgi:hypothetical protein
MQIQSSPNLLGFNPYAIPYQGRLLELVRRDWDYAEGNLEILLSGSYGSAKSIMMAHLAVTHCMNNPRARVCLARKTLPDLKSTIYQEIIEHIQDDLVEGVDYEATPTRGYIKFLGSGSEIISRSWADKKYKKGRSLKLSMLVLEELTENNEEDKQAFDTLKARIRRLPHVKENLLIAATNPDSPTHWVHKYFMDTPQPYKKVFYSVTDDNPFLDPIYVKQLRESMTPEEARRFLEGEWIEIAANAIYYNYSSEKNLKAETVYEFDCRYPIRLMHDFNIGVGKPMSAATGQCIDGVWHIKKTYLMDGFRTAQVMDEMADDGLFEHKAQFLVYGDASGRHNDTRSNQSDWDIIEDFLANYKRKDKSSLEFSIDVPRSNPPVKRRWKHTNLKFLNANGKIGLYVYKEAIAADEGFRLTKLKKGSGLVEDDSYRNQHVCGAIGYAVDYIEEYETTGPGIATFF